ncbi:MAG: hypothetical protein JRG69_01430, partial [Deltaproteobacteria bacterium]|nr:hypothetical protein [Deltaproteobacteria bacterium]
MNEKKVNKPKETENSESKTLDQDEISRLLEETQGKDTKETTDQVDKGTDSQTIRSEEQEEKAQHIAQTDIPDKVEEEKFEAET